MQEFKLCKFDISKILIPMNFDFIPTPCVTLLVEAFLAFISPVFYSCHQQALTARNSELTSMKLQWESKLSELQAKNAHNINIEKEQAMQVHVYC